MLDKKRLSLIAVVLIVVGGLGTGLLGRFQWGFGSERVRTQIFDTLDASAIRNLDVRASNVRIQLHSIAGDEIRVESRESEGNLRASVEVRDSDLVIEAEYRQGPIHLTIGYRPGPVIDIFLPEIVLDNASVFTRNARIEVEALIAERVVLSTTNARINAANLVATKTELFTTNSRISADGVWGDLAASTTNGRLDIRNVEGFADLRNTNGRIDVRNVGGDLSATTTNGRIEFTNQTIDQHVDLWTSNSRISVNLVERPANASFNLSTTNGRMELFGQRNMSRETFGAGEHQVTLSTTNGRISVD